MRKRNSERTKTDENRKIRTTISIKSKYTNRAKKSKSFRAPSAIPLSARIANLKLRRPDSLILLGITHAETVDQIFPNWLNDAFVRGRDRDDTNYRPYDLNMPASLLRRPPAHYQFDSPLTEHGKICAALTGRGILLANYQPNIIFTSPELRCLETAHSLQRSLHVHHWCLCVEPSLAEYTEFRENSRDFWLGPEQLRQKEISYSINQSYIPLLKFGELPEVETPQEFIQRLQRFYEHIIVNFVDRCVLLVGNITGIFVLNDGIATTSLDLQKPHDYMNSCQPCAIKVTTDGKIEAVNNPILPLTRTLFDAKLLK